MVADGDIGDTEIDWLDRQAVHELLGLARHELHALFETCCEDLLSSEQLKCADACPVDERTLADLMGEIDDPALRLKSLRICADLAEADADVAQGGSIVLVAAVELWGLHYQMLPPRSQDQSLGTTCPALTAHRSWQEPTYVPSPR